MGKMIGPRSSKSYTPPFALPLGISPNAYCHHGLGIIWLEGMKQALSSLTKRKNFLGSLSLKQSPGKEKSREAPRTSGVSVSLGHSVPQLHDPVLSGTFSQYESSSSQERQSD